VTKVFLVRHASAGNRKRWTGDDRLRPLDERGFREAEGLVDLIRERRPTRVLSSGYVRCRQTVEPLAEALGLEVEERAELAEGALSTEVHRLVDRLSGELPVLCTHADVVLELLGEESPKASTWVLELASGELERLEYLRPPA
jgi:phosphohistidine phosphatase SixA